MLRISEIFGSQYQIYENIKNDVMFKIRCCIPGIVQSYNSSNNTAEIQPAIRERMIMEDGSIEYMDLPLLINVPIVFPRTSSNGITFPIKKNDEVLVLFSDLSIDNFWEKGSVQNPVEVRRHDLSDGIAIPCTLSLVNSVGATSDTVIESGDSKITISDDDITIKTADSEVSANQIQEVINQLGTTFNFHSHSFTVNGIQYKVSFPVFDSFGSNHHCHKFTVNGVEYRTTYEILGENEMDDHTHWFTVNGTSYETTVPIGG